MNALPLTTNHPSPAGELAERRLRESAYFFLKTLTCHFDHGTLTLRGRVPHSRLREFAETIVSRVDGVYSINNQIEVYDPARYARSA
jgi:osmotically-inducible protein OsmY